MICINCRFLSQQITGVQRYAIEICLQLRLFDKHIIFLSPGNIIHQSIAEKLNVKIIGTKSGYYWEQVELPDWLKKHGNPLLVNLCNIAPLRYNNNSITIHDIAVLKHKEWFSKKFFLFYKVVMPLLVKRAKKIFTVSEFSKSEIISYFSINPDSVFVVNNAVSKTISPNDTSDRWELNDKKYILAVSSINPRKNFKTIIEAFNKIDSDMHLVVAGEANKAFNKVDYINEAVKNKKILFLGYVSDEELGFLYKNAFVFVYVSLYEGFGIPMLEAMSCGCPVIAANNTSMIEIGRNAALFVDALDPEQLRKSILDINNDAHLRNNLIANGHLVNKEYTWEESARKLYERLFL
ncbi:glycosyltransferase family 4 protein [Mucilaginibacter flavidus]|uniref:glycosyltransferase family 4 protein n=1 Tax=Mucilaginibacter flavidus TaxID=2949309 RepID=UPI002092854A|nr:glycosyltransferase family 1 protein [Mucilaginibacter flavidus]MCO5948248.1 glycosyltransferase family 4 protein [Mucilaginibacter flavidus]